MTEPVEQTPTKEEVRKHLKEKKVRETASVRPKLYQSEGVKGGTKSRAQKQADQKKKQRRQVQGSNGPQQFDTQRPDAQPLAAADSTGIADQTTNEASYPQTPASYAEEYAAESSGPYSEGLETSSHPKIYAEQPRVSRSERPHSGVPEAGKSAKLYTEKRHKASRLITEDAGVTGKPKLYTEDAGVTGKPKLYTEEPGSENSKLQSWDTQTARKTALHTEDTPTTRKSRLHTEDTPTTTRKPRLFYEKAAAPKRLIHDEASPPLAQRKALSKAAAVVSGKIRREIAAAAEDEGGNENVGTESVLHLEAAAEYGVRALSDARRGHRLRQNRATRSVEQPSARANPYAEDTLKYQQQSQLQYQPTDPPQEGSNPMSKWQQKQAIKRDYAAAKAGKTAGTIAKSEATRNATEAVSKSALTSGGAAESTAKHGPLIGIVGGILLLVILLLSMMQSCAMMFAGPMSSVMGTAYTADPEEILTAEAYYLSLEDVLWKEVSDIESTYPDYEEYIYDLDSIGHDPHELAALLTILLDAYTADGAKPTMDQVFAAQYDLQIEEQTVTRTRTEVRSRQETYTDPETGAVSTRVIPYEVEIPYDCTILKVTLTSKTIGSIAEDMLDADAYERYQACVSVKGYQPDVFNPDGDASPSPTTAEP